MKQFDVFLSQRLTECDLIVYSIPYRDEVTIQNQTMLQCCIDYYSLLKMIAVQHGSVLAARIDKALAYIIERFSAHNTIQANAQFVTQDFWYPQHENTGLALSPGLQDLFYRRYLEGDCTTSLKAQVDKFDLSLQVGRGASGFAIGSDVIVGNYAIGLDQLKSGILPSLKVEENITAGISPTQAMLGLSQETIAILRRYRYLSDMDDLTLDDFDKYLLTDLDYLEIEGDVTINLGHLSAGPHLCTEMVENTISFLPPITSNADLSQHITETFMRSRLLSDLDGSLISDFDNELLPNLDFVVLDE